jgi:hypothetical protein
MEAKKSHCPTPTKNEGRAPQSIPGFLLRLPPRNGHAVGVDFIVTSSNKEPLTPAMMGHATPLFDERTMKPGQTSPYIARNGVVVRAVSFKTGKICASKQRLKRSPQTL